MEVLPSDPDLGHLRRQAKELLRAAQANDASASDRIRAVSDRVTLSAAQLALAREYGFPDWPKLKLEVERRRMLDDRDLDKLAALMSQHPDLATSEMEHWCDHPLGASPLGYISMARFDTGPNRWRDLSGTAAVARTLINAGALINGNEGDSETPLMTAASYGDAEVARVLVEAGGRSR